MIISVIWGYFVTLEHTIDFNLIPISVCKSFNNFYYSVLFPTLRCQCRSKAQPPELSCRLHSQKTFLPIKVWDDLEKLSNVCRNCFVDKKKFFIFWKHIVKKSYLSLSLSLISLKFVKKWHRFSRVCLGNRLVTWIFCCILRKTMFVLSLATAFWNSGPGSASAWHRRPRRSSRP